MLGPLGVLALVLGSKKKKSKVDVLLFLLVFAVASGMTLTACTLNSKDIGITPTGTPMPVSATATQTQGIVTAVISTPTQLVTVTAPAPSSTPVFDCPAHIYDDDENEEIKQRIRDEFGIILGGSFYGTQEWPSVHIQIIYGALSRINAALDGNLKSRLGTEAVFHKKKSLDGKYSGYTRSTGSIEFYLVDDFPYHLIYHEMGHLLNNAQGQKYTSSLEHVAVYSDYPAQSGQFVMGIDCPATDDCSSQYSRIDGQGLISLSLHDPCGKSVDAELHPASNDGNNAGEEWGDLFANYVAGNFNVIDPIGRAKYDWVRYQLFGG
jgi:hypothetical protein